MGKIGAKLGQFFFTTPQISELRISHVTKLTSIVCIYNTMSDTKYEEDTLMRSKVMANLV